MVDTVYAFARHWFANYETYITYFYNKWVVFLLIAALLELYTTHRISYELKKEDAGKGLRNKEKWMANMQIKHKYW